MLYFSAVVWLGTFMLWEKRLRNIKDIGDGY
jgi:hypothetical protein